MIINPQISIPPDVNVRDPIKASTTNGILAALRQERTPKQLSTRLKNVFDLYSFSSFRSRQTTPIGVAVSQGKIYVHAAAYSPYSYNGSTVDIDLSNGGAWPLVSYIVAKLDWATNTVSVEFAIPVASSSSSATLIVPLCQFTRYGSSASASGYSLTQVLHVGDIHVCKAFAATT